AGSGPGLPNPPLAEGDARPAKYLVDGPENDTEDVGRTLYKQHQRPITARNAAIAPRCSTRSRATPETEKRRQQGAIPSEKHHSRNYQYDPRKTARGNAINSGNKPVNAFLAGEYSGNV
ncbi:hypothetical protein, partial [Frankia sp. CiP3]|uniref:hypothetical protein n=1 Tax=Frankia sp. CiP3 TaxID=2880971 RepID=UPI001EF50868